MADMYDWQERLPPELLDLGETIPLATGLIVACRMVPIVLLLPLGRMHWNWKTKIVLAVLLTALVTPVQHDSGLFAPFLNPPNATSAGVTNSLPPMNLLISEGITGLALGTAILFVVESILIAGQWLGMTSGVPLKTTTQSQIGNTSIGMLVSLITVAVLLTSGMQRMLITALLDSYQWLGVGELSVTQEPDHWFDQAAVVATWSFTLALRIVLPVMIIMITVNLALGWISRQSPALNHFVIGIPLNTFVLLGAVMLTLGSAMLAMQIEIQAALATLGVL
ncbi:MAG: flagellar biosynthetic protein FliR [Planctomycetaceae bacterium]|nr:flagellar biosynthetic protein FliR [Planctomycetaceae bacterium]